MYTLFPVFAFQIFQEDTFKLIASKYELSHKTYEQYKEYTRYIEFENDVTEIGTYAFYNWTFLSSVIFPKSLTIIHEFAFL